VLDNLLNNIQAALRDALSTVAVFVPRLLLFLVILLLGWLIAKGLRKVVDKLLERVGFERAVERGGIGRALSRSKYDASHLIAALVYYAIVLVTLQLAFGVFGPNPISELLVGIVAFLPRLVVAIIIVVIAAAIAAAVKDLLAGALGGLSYGRVIANVAAVFITALGVIAALSQIGIAIAVTLPVLITVLATVGGILVVGIGGGLIMPMRQRSERWLNHAEQEAYTQSQAYQRGREDAARVGATPATPEASPGPVRAQPAEARTSGASVSPPDQEAPPATR
jgi:Conserved TM helix